MFYPTGKTGTIPVRCHANQTGAQVYLSGKHGPQYRKPLSSRVDRERADICPPSVANSRSLLTFVTAVSVLWKRRYADCVSGMRSLLPRNNWSRHWAILSNNLDRNNKFDTGRKFFKSLASRPLFLSSGRTTACLISDGK